MEYQTKSVVFGAAWVATEIAAVAARPAGALVAAGKLRLSKLPGIIANPNLTRAQLAANEAAYTGYPAGGYAVVFSAQVNLTTQILGLLVNQLFLVTADDPQVNETITAWWIDDGTNLVVMEAFAEGATWSQSGPGDFLALLASVPWPLYVGGLSA